MKFDFNFGSLFKSFVPLFISILPILFFVCVIILIIYCFKAKVRIKWRTFKGKSFRPERGDFGLYVYCGQQGRPREDILSC